MSAFLSGDRDLFTTNRAGGEAAEALFPNQGLKFAARGFGLAHERAAQYLAQAPVMVFAAYSGDRVRVGALYMQHRIWSQCERGVKLKALMANLGYPPPLRRLHASILAPSHHDTIRALSQVPSTVLGRVMPEKPGAQRKWLGALAAWAARHDRHSAFAGPAALAWAVEHFAIGGIGTQEAGDMADFMIAAGRNVRGARFSFEWGWARATEEQALWHDRLTIDGMLRGTPFSAESIVDAGHHPDNLDLDPYQFVALRTPHDIGAEGTAMRHCVASYLPRVINGDCHIISVRRSGERVATLELGRQWDVRQIRARFNKSPPPTASAGARLYAAMIRERLRAAV